MRSNDPAVTVVEKQDARQSQTSRSNERREGEEREREKNSQKSTKRNLRRPAILTLSRLEQGECSNSDLVVLESPLEGDRKAAV